MRSRREALPHTKLAAHRGHRSHVAGTRRVFAGRNKSALQDALHADACAMARRFVARDASVRRDDLTTDQKVAGLRPARRSGGANA